MQKVRNSFSKIMATILAMTLMASTIVYAGVIETLEQDMDEISADDTVNNTGVFNVGTNYGVIKSVAQVSTVGTNNGYIDQNSGKVTDNCANSYDEDEMISGGIRVNSASGVVGTNKGLVGENTGKIENNYYSGIVDRNVDDENSTYGKIDKNLGIVQENYGTVVNDEEAAEGVEEPFGKVINQRGGSVKNKSSNNIVENLYGGTVTGSGVITNMRGGTVTGTNTITNYYGGNIGTLSDDFSGSITNNHGEIDGNIWTVSLNLGRINNNSNLVEENKGYIYQNINGMGDYDVPKGVLKNYTEGTIDSNECIIEENNGLVCTNYDEGTVNVNNGKWSLGVLDNYGLVIDNNGHINENKEEGTVTNNKRTDDNNVGLINTNAGLIGVNHGVIETNNGNENEGSTTIKGIRDNHPDGIINENNGYVYNNAGKIDINNQDGHVVTNSDYNSSTHNAKIPINKGTVEANVDIIETNIGTVEQHQGVVTDNFGSVATVGNEINLPVITNQYEGTVQDASTVLGFTNITNYFGGNIAASKINIINNFTDDRINCTNQFRSIGLAENENDHFSVTYGDGFTEKTIKRYDDDNDQITETKKFFTQVNAAAVTSDCNATLTVSPDEGYEIVKTDNFKQNVTLNPEIGNHMCEIAEHKNEEGVFDGSYDITFHTAPGSYEMLTLADFRLGIAKKNTVTVINGDGSGAYIAGKEVSIKANAPAIGKQFKEWTTKKEITIVDATSTETTFTMINADVTVEATYEDILYSATVTNGNGTGDYKYNQIVNISANEPETGKKFKEWTSDDEITFANSKSESTSFNMPAKAVTVTATYEDIVYTVKATNDGNGSSTADPVSGKTGVEVTIKASPKSGYEFKEWKLVKGDVSFDKSKASTTFKIKNSNVEVKALFKQKTTPTPDPKKTDISGATVTLSKKSFTYKDKAQKPVVKSVKLGKKTLKADRDFMVTFPKSSKNAGTYKITVKGIGNYTGSVTAKYTIKQADNPMNVTAVKKEYTVKYSNLAKKDQTIKKDKIFNFKKNGAGKITYSLSSAKKGKKSFKKFFSISNKGKLKIMKGLEKGTYSVKINVKAKGNKNYKEATKTVKFTVRVKK